MGRTLYYRGLKILLKSGISEMATDHYPVVILYRYDRYSDIDGQLKNVKCDLKITSSNRDLECLYNAHYHVLVTYGPSANEYISDVMSVISDRLCKRWIHFTTPPGPAKFEHDVAYCYIHNVLGDRVASRPLFSIFTTCYNSFDKIKRPYQSLIAQTERDWEWVIVDDSTDEAHFAYLKRKFSNEPRIRLYNRSGNSGSIGNVKNEAVSLCRGKYVLELDHDDLILPDLIADAAKAFATHPKVGFVYMDYCNMYENGEQFSYGDFACLGYAGYYCQKYKDKWVNVMSTPQINNVTMSSLISMPNHPRIWKRDLLLQIGNYSEMLPICDDLEILLRTCYNTTMLKIPKLAYIQIFNDGGNNFSTIRGAEINRLGPQFIGPISSVQNRSNDFFKSVGAWDDVSGRVQIWKRPQAPPYANVLFHPDYDTQICIIGMKGLEMNMERIMELYRYPRNDFLLLLSEGSYKEVIEHLERLGLTRLKFYILAGSNDETLVKYFYRVYRGVDGVIIFDGRHSSNMANTRLRLEDGTGSVFDHLLIELPEQELAEQYIRPDCVVLELGARYGSVSCIINRKLSDPRNQVSVEPAAEIWSALRRNRDQNGCAFHILEGAISREPLGLVQGGYATRSVGPEGLRGVEAVVPVLTLEEVEAKFGLKFNTLVADCEGFLGKFLEENPQLYEKISLFMFEKDFPKLCDYDKILKKLREHNFVNKFSSLHEVWIKAG